MATFLDIGLLSVFQVIFPFLFVLTLVFAMFSKYVPFFKENSVYAAIAAIALAIMTMFSPIAVQTINLMAPWLVLLVVFIIFLIIAFAALGYDEKYITGTITSDLHSNTIFLWILSLVLIIALGSLTFVISSESGFTDPTATTAEGVDGALITGGGETGGFFQVITHPKLLGMAVLLLIAMFAIKGLATPTQSK